MTVFARIAATRVSLALRIEKLAVDPSLPASTFSLAFPAGADVMRSDDGFRRLRLDQVGAAVGYRPLVANWVPDGYHLAEAAVARETAPTGKEGGDPSSRMVVSLSYRRGLDQLLVTTRLRGDDTWHDPVASPQGYTDAPTLTTLTAGALAGTKAHAVVSAHTTPISGHSPTPLFSLSAATSADPSWQGSRIRSAPGDLVADNRAAGWSTYGAQRMQIATRNGRPERSRTAWLFANCRLRLHPTASEPRW